METFSCRHVREGHAAVATIVATVKHEPSPNDRLQLQRARVECHVQLCLLCIADARVRLEGYAKEGAW